VYLSLAQDSGPKGSSDRQSVQFDSTAINGAVDETVFHFPAGHGNATLDK